jgi:hypothetical protein
MESIQLNMIELFSTLTDEELDSIAKLSSVKRSKKNEVILVNKLVQIKADFWHKDLNLSL